jgi:hypothetical protein
MKIEQPIKYMPTEKEPDFERENILKKVKDYFSEVLEGYQTSEYSPEKDMIKVNSVIIDMEHNDYNSAYEYLEEEIERLNNRIVEVSKNEIGRVETVPKCKDAIQRLEKLRDSLHLSEK